MRGPLSPNNPENNTDASDKIASDVGHTPFSSFTARYKQYCQSHNSTGAGHQSSHLEAWSPAKSSLGLRHASSIQLPTLRRISMCTSTPKTQFDDTLGALLIGGLFSMALWGTMCSQTYFYFMYRFKDPRYMKILITFLWFLDTFDSTLNVHVLYFYMVKNYSNPLGLCKPIWSIIVHVATTAISNFVITTMFIEKVFFLSNRNIWLTACLMTTSVGYLVVGLVITVKSIGLNSFSELDDTMSTLFYLQFALGVGSDFGLAASLCYFLHRTRTGFQGTDSMISVLMLYTINTGAIVAIDALLGIVMYSVMPNNFIFLAFYLLLSKLYLNAYLATLNAREKLRYKKNEMISIHISQISNCQYAVENPSPTVDKESNDMLQAPVSHQEGHSMD